MYSVSLSHIQDWWYWYQLFGLLEVHGSVGDACIGVDSKLYSDDIRDSSVDHDAKEARSL